MGLVKAAAAPAGLATFSMRDVEEQAKALLARARQAADRLLAEAQREASAMKERALAEGQVEGRREGIARGIEEGRNIGRQQALEEHRTQFTDAVAALGEAMTDLEASRAELEAAALEEVVGLAVAVARRVTKRQGLVDPAVLTENLREAMKLVVHAGDVKVAIHPSQRQALEVALPALRLEIPKLGHVELTDDPAIEPGGCRLFAGGGQIDATLVEQLDRVVADLTPDADGADAGPAYLLTRMRSADATQVMPYLAAQLEAVEGTMPFRVVGRVQGISGMTIEASDLTLPLGSLCRIDSFGGRASNAEVIGFRQDRTLLMPLSGTSGVARGDAIEGLSAAPRVWCSDQLLGRVLDGFGQPVDGKGPLRVSQSRRIDGRGVRPLERQNIRQPISTSVRAVDGLLTCGLGQRMGIFSGPGVGKSTLLSQIAKHTSADVSVVALIGERGREVQEFLENSLGEEGLRRCVVIVSTSDDAPLLRVRAAKIACTVAEYFRDRGQHVLLLMDSITRLAQAQRQIGLAAGEPPATKGFPPSVFALMPEILERAGNTASGSITGFYTVLVEGDDFNEPIPDAVKGITDGHLWLSRSLANRGHFPAIDLLQSISRVRNDVTDKPHQAAARRVAALTALYHDIEDLINIGAYVPGKNAEFDLAKEARPRIVEFLKQEAQSPVSLEAAKRQLTELVAWIDQAERVLKAPPGRPGRPAMK